jgi:HEAT repeat protein
MVIPPELFDYFIAGLQGPNRYEQLRAAFALGELGDIRAVEPLVAALDNGKSGNVIIVEALQKLGEAAYRPLVRAYRDCILADIEEHYSI